jgi:hypothetical protein
VHDGGVWGRDVDTWVFDEERGKLIIVHRI